MSKETEKWTFKDWVQVICHLMVILAIVATAVNHAVNVRSKSIEETRKAIVKAWTNEGDVTSKETVFIDLQLAERDGDIVGTLESPKLDNPLDVSAEVGWFSTDLVISGLSGTAVNQVATAKVRLAGNGNRLEWQLIGSQAPDYLPRSSVLWPNPVASSE